MKFRCHTAIAPCVHGPGYSGRCSTCELIVYEVGLMDEDH